MLSIKTKKLLALVLFSMAFLVTRIPFLGYDEINPDAVNWHFRSEQFIVGLKSRDFFKTYQHYHPGVPLMWIMGTPIEIYRQINPSARVYNQDNFIFQHQLAKYSLVLVQLVLSLVLLLALKTLIGFKKAILAVSFFTFEPFFVGNSRLLHLDVLFTLFVTLSLVYAFRFYRDNSLRLVALSGLFAGLAFLTKSVGSILLPFIILILLGKKRVAGLGIFLGSTLFVTFALFPALWVKPVYVLDNIINEGLRIGTRRGHEQVVMGEQLDEAGPGFYPLILALKTSPLIWLGVGILIFMLAKNYRHFQKVDRKLILFMGIFYLAYFAGMSLASKKIDRYMIPVYPFLGVIAGIAFLEFFDRLKRSKDKYSYLIVVTGLGLFSVLYPLIKLYPYYFTYTNPFFGSAENANNIVGQKPFGIGIWELHNRIIARYGAGQNLGFIDKKPMSMIYNNSKLFDIREAGTKKYDLIILGPNEEMPENVLNGEFKFVKDDSMDINGLEFWRIYKKA